MWDYVHLPHPVVTPLGLMTTGRSQKFVNPRIYIYSVDCVLPLLNRINRTASNRTDEKEEWKHFCRAHLPCHFMNLITKCLSLNL